MKRRSSKAPTQRQLRVGEEIRHSLSYILSRGEIREPALQGVMITVTEVRVSPDLKNATAFIIPLGGGDKEATAPLIEALKRASPYLRRLVADKVNLRYAPRISFQHDESFDEASKIDALLRRPEVARDLSHDLALEEDTPEEDNRENES